MPPDPSPQPLQTALTHHGAGRLDEAKTIYRQIIAAQPRHADALHLLGAANLQSGQAAEAVALIERAIQASPTTSNYYVTLGVALDGLGRLDDAIRAFQKAAELAGDKASVQSNLGNALLKAGRFDEAVTTCLHAVRLEPNSPSANLNLGVAMYAAKRWDEAVVALRKAASLSPKSAAAHMHLAMALGRKGEWEQAVQSCKRAVAIEPNNAEAYHSLAMCLHSAERWPECAAAAREAIRLQPNLGQAWLYLGAALHMQMLFDEAATALDRAVELRPNDAEAHNLHGWILCCKEEHARSEAACRRALALSPDNHEAHNNLGRALQGQDRLDEAVAAFEKALQLKPDMPEAINNLGGAYAAKGDTDQAMRLAKAALNLRPEFPSAHWKLSLLLLALGQYEQGWIEYEHRWRIREFGADVVQRFEQPAWNGSDLQGRRIMVYAEQGFGDVIQFCRYLPLVEQRGGRIVLLGHPGLRRLMEKLPHVEQFAPLNEPIPAHDVQSPLLSLPRIFNTTLQTVPAAVPYLHADPGAAAAWRARFPKDGRKKVGFIWANRPKPPGRCPPNTEWEPLAAATRDVWLCSLQKRDTSVEARETPAGFELTDWTEELRDFADTAALLDGLDLIITVDTAVAHLAGAMGKQVWMLLRYAADWRWMIDREDSPWYPTMRLFRQPKIGDWKTPIARIGEALRDWTKQ